MARFIGLDIGTSAVKAVLVDEAQAVLAEAAEPLATERPRPLWSEQHPDAWWRAVATVLDRLAALAPLAEVAAIGLSGQMHGAVLLGADLKPLRPAILWNDGRAFAEAAALNADHPGLAAIVGVPAMAGFTAPKLAWLARHEPPVRAGLKVALSPKDYLRLVLTGELATDLSDAAGTWWLDEARRDWCDAALAACGLDRSFMPRLVEGTVATGSVRAELGRRWGLPPGVIVAAGAGDTAAGAIGVGVVAEGTAVASLGTSANLLAATACYRPDPGRLVHAFCHALPGRWFQMAAMLNGASCLSWAASLVGADVATLVAEAEAAYAGPGDLVFLPYLAGERTPHDDPHARGAFFGLTAASDRRALVQAVLEGVAFTFADAVDCIAATGTPLGEIAAVGGGARSDLWMRILASVVDRPILRHRGGDKGPAFGAARLARLALTGEAPEAVCAAPPILDRMEPEPGLAAAYRPRLARFRRLYAAVREEFRPL
ncbi:xylulokinase [Chelatococcus sp. SYSU_G07232]|uniref:Xylulose kinase n=1 Tax=Chelatococcus albus TaxID=3047466 RepID=A0ABT7AIG2_9HYPH|nr:xylulokinase [Chelatococcus sp. SYSU_G07232]MDJ1159165.1 xylulokinase [Chelatococcus sp. SYSU_G07232]